LTSGDIAVFDASGNVKDGGAPSAIGSSLVLISTQTASSSASISFTGLTAYDNYLLLIENAVPATDGTILFLRITENNGVSYPSTNYSWVDFDFQFNASATHGNGNDTGFNMVGAQLVSITSGLGLSGEVRLKNLTSTTAYKWITADVAFYNNGGQVGKALTSGYYTANTSAIDGFQVFYSSGNISSGKFSLYGIRNS